MIKPQELRIGSLLDVDGNIIKVGKIEENFISWNIAKDTAKFKIWNPFLPISDKRINPIPLTEEILLNFGFEIEWLLSDSKGYYVLINNKKIRIKFVHSLQNLFFSLCGEELTVK